MTALKPEDISQTKQDLVKYHESRIAEIIGRNGSEELVEEHEEQIEQILRNC